MLLNRVEYAIMNNPIRGAVQRYIEARRLRAMGGVLDGGTVLEIGCGRGVGVEIILDVFHADAVHAFDLDRRMVRRACARLRRRRAVTRVWTGDATAIAAPDHTYDADFDFGIIHHVPYWRVAVAEVARVLKPGGRLYAEEVLDRFVQHPLSRWLLRHPQVDRFDAAAFRTALVEVGMTDVQAKDLWGGFAWFVAQKQPVGVPN